MKKLYRKGTVHPSAPLISDHLAFLPAAILTLTVALSPPDREVLAYLLSCSSTNFSASRNTAGDHTPSFSCNCFRCYMSYWVRWDSSPNRQLIHEIIDAFEDGVVLVTQNKKENNKKVRRNRGVSVTAGDEFNPSSQLIIKDEFESVKESSSSSEDVENEEEIFEKGPGGVSKFVSSIGERIWSVWGM